MLCGCRLDDSNQTAEHIIPNAIGGRATLSDFICRGCNSKAGTDWDSALAEQLQALCLFFGITRQRGQTPAMSVTTTTGEDLRINSDGSLTFARPTMEVSFSEDGVRLNASVRNERELRQMLVGLKRKYPQIDVDGNLAKAEREAAFPPGLIRHSFALGGEVSGRSLVKSVMAVAKQAGIGFEFCEEGLAYLRDADALPCYQHYYETDLVLNRPAGSPFHCVAVRADASTGVVLGYIEYFGVHRVLVRLGKHYVGTSAAATCALDPRTGKTLDIEVNLSMTPDQVAIIDDRQRGLPDEMLRTFDTMLGAELKQRYRRNHDRALEAAVELAWAECGAKEGDFLEERHIAAISRIVVDQMSPYWLRGVRSARLRR